MCLVTKFKFSEFLIQSSEKLNNLDTYEETRQRATRNGFKLENIIYNGYLSSAELQAIQDNSIQSRTQNRLNAEIEKQNNDLLNLKLDSENKRLNIETDLKRLKCEFEEKLLTLRKNFEANTNELNQKNQLELKEKEHASQNQIKSKSIEIKEEYLNMLSELPSLDLNKYQIELAKSKNRCEHVYELID